jgi:hypothetical protein
MKTWERARLPLAPAAIAGACAFAFALALALAAMGGAACSSAGHGAATSPPDGSAPDSGGPPPPPPFQPVSAFTSVAKAKNILVGLAPTDAEVQQVVADPTQLRTLVEGWMALPAYTSKMQRFFELALQQTQVSAADFADQFYPKQIATNVTTTPLLVQNVQQSFARTMIELIGGSAPLTDAVTTTQLKMTTAMKEMYAFLDVWEVDDNGKVTDRFKQANPGLAIVAETAAGPIPIADTLDPTNANYMHWYNPDVATNDTSVAGCTEDPVTLTTSAISLHYLLYGSLDGHKSSTGVQCPPSNGSATAPQLDVSSDFSDWKMVTVRAPKAGEATTKFYDLPSLRTATELVLSIPRMGFFTTPAFFANWQTNSSNQMRVTLNQALIVALGAQVDGSDRTMAPANPPGLDAVHAANLQCAACHDSLDPLRSIFSATLSWNYHNQLDTTLTAQKGLFVFQGVTQEVGSLADFGATLASHPLFASAWVQKLCTYVNSSPCVTTDPEFQRVVGVFQSSGYQWNTLVAELMSSPLTTNATETATADANGEVVAVSRRDHLCAALDSRLGLSDVCGLEAVTKKQMQMTIPQIASGLPSDGYGRGATMPVLPNQPTLFYRAGLENICEGVAAQVIDVAAASQTAGITYWSSASPDAAIADFVGTIMALVPSDPRSGPATDILKAHFTAAMQQGASASNALKSTFVAACLAPSAVSIGL